MQRDLVIIGRVGEKTALDTVSGHMDELKKRYSSSYLHRGIEALSMAFIEDEVLDEAFAQCDYIYPIRDESLQTALWNVGEELKSGLTVRLPDVPIAQFTIELAEFDDTNPYRNDSTGCIICVTPSSGALCDLLAQKGVPFAAVGYLTDTNDRCIINGDIKTYLTGK